MQWEHLRATNPLYTFYTLSYFLDTRHKYQDTSNLFSCRDDVLNHSCDKLYIFHETINVVLIKCTIETYLVVDPLRSREGL